MELRLNISMETLYKQWISVIFYVTDTHRATRDVIDYSIMFVILVWYLYITFKLIGYAVKLHQWICGDKESVKSLDKFKFMSLIIECYII